LVLLGIENFEFILFTFTGKNDYYDVLGMTIFKTRLTFLSGCQAAKKKDDSPSLIN
jgi:hypothetical protein